jgi:hypothetical protein
MASIRVRDGSEASEDFELEGEREAEFEEDVRVGSGIGERRIFSGIVPADGWRRVGFVVRVPPVAVVERRKLRLSASNAGGERVSCGARGLALAPARARVR